MQRNQEKVDRYAVGDGDQRAYLLIVVFWSMMVPVTSQHDLVKSLSVCWMYHSLLHRSYVDDLVALWMWLSLQFIKWEARLIRLYLTMADSISWFVLEVAKDSLSGRQRPLAF